MAFTGSMRDFFRSIVNGALDKIGLELINKRIRYGEDGLHTIHNHDFLEDNEFKESLKYVNSEIGRNKNNELRFRNYIALKLAEYSITLSPTFCECGVGDGVISLSILKYFNLKKIKMPNLFLFDTFSGIEASLVPSNEIAHWGVTVEEKKSHYKEVYNSDVESVRRRFFKLSDKVTIVQGYIPSTFTIEMMDQLKKSGPISFLHIDMNNSVPEVEAFRTLFPKMATGGIILLDDYAYSGYEFQKNAIDNLCADMNLPMPISLPTGQGLVIKPNITQWH